MTIENPQLVTFLVFAIAGLILFQTALVFAFIWIFRTVIQRLDAKVDILATKSRDVVRFASQSVEAVEKTSSRLADVRIFLEGKFQEATQIGQKADRTTASQLNHLRFQLEKVNRNTDVLLSKFTVQTFKVHRAILDPSMRLSAILRAGAAAIRHAFSRGDGSPASHVPDRPDFI